jgi:PIN domain nuclease of toxin-antitoxin system
MSRGILLDTHILVALVNDREIFGKTAKHLLRSPERLFYSPLSIAEMRLKEAVKKQSFLADDLVDGLVHLGYRELQLTSRAANDITRFPALHHHDPFDKLLLAQASHHDLLFITADRALTGLDLDFVHDAYT